jgi:hypothetical protein
VHRRRAVAISANDQSMLIRRKHPGDLTAMFTALAPELLLIRLADRAGLEEVGPLSQFSTPTHDLSGLASFVIGLVTRTRCSSR